MSKPVGPSAPKQAPMPKGQADHLRKYQFKPGQSGNPGGRRNTAKLEAACRELTDEAISVLREVMNNPRAKDVARITAATRVIEFGWGKAKERVEITNEYLDKLPMEKLLKLNKQAIETLVESGDLDESIIYN